MKTKHNEMVAVAGAVALTACASLSLQAKTLALWPIDFDPDNQEYNLRCATDAKYDLSFSNAGKTFTTLSGTDTLGWNLPPNPDGSDFRFTPYTYTSLHSASGDGYLMTKLGEMLTAHKTYTIEGYVKFTGEGNLGTGSAWVILVAVGQNDATTYRQQLRMAYDSTTKKYHLHLWNGTHAEIDADFPDKEFSISDLRDGKWHHWAYTQTPNNGSGNSVFEAFWDGESAGTLKAAPVTTTTSNGQGFFLLGTRTQYGNTIKGAMDYVRISDEVLTPSQFLRAGGGSGTVITAPTTKTVGYWRLGKDANGGVDSSSSLGGWPFVRSYWGSADCRTTTLTADLEGAFEGQPPNPTVTLEGGNRGSFAINKTSVNSVVKFPEVSSAVLCSKDFTVETYFRPDHFDATVTGSRALFSSISSSGNLGWQLLLCTNARTSANAGRRFRLIGRDATGALYQHVDFGGSIAGWNDEWKHLALVHKATGGAKGYGCWMLYVDGQLYGTLDDTRSFADASAAEFRLGASEVNAAFGKFDCLRVSEAALAPNQFLCAANGVAATNVKAFFPLDVSTNGVAYSIFADVAGTASKGDVLAANSVAAATDDAPTVTNPDKSPNFRSSFGGTTGSVGFSGYVASGANPALYSVDAAVLNSLNAANEGREYTIEAYVQHDGASGNKEIFLASSTLLTDIGSPKYWPSMDIRLSYGSNGFILSDMISQSHADTGKQFQDVETKVTIDPNKWYHVAMTCSVQVNEGTAYGVWRLYVDGVLKYTSLTYKINSSRAMTGLEIGGRHWSNSAFPGKIAHLRISKGVLDPSEFLCATPAAESAATTSFWPLNFANNVVDLDNRVDVLQPFTSSAVVGSTDRAAHSPAKATIPAEAVRNVGSVVLSDGCMTSVAAADKIGNLGKPFTVEGYVKWTDAATKNREVICGTFRNGHGWKLVLDNTGATPAFRIYGSGRLPTSPFVNDAFGYAAASFADAWHHVALAYDPNESGTWRLYVDGTLVGSAANRWNPCGIDIRQPIFLIGADASDADATFVGGLDLWRISTGTRAVADYLYPPLPPPGTLLIVR